jgi:phage terminase large subunit
MTLQETTALRKIRALKKRIRIVQGGTSAGKTYDILLDELNEAIMQDGILTTIMSDTMPNLRHGAMRDFLKICHETNVWDVAEWNSTYSTLTLPNRSIIEFYSADSEDALGARRDRLFINEANRITKDAFDQLEVRTEQKITLDFNPVNQFWAHDLLKRPDVDFVKLNYLDNEALSQNIVNALELRKGDGTSNWWRVYGLGEIGSLEGNVYEGWIPVDDIPQTAVLKRYGVDFGFSNDPTAVVAVYEDEDESLYLKTELCDIKILTPVLIEKLKKLPDALFVCDNARPEIIAEMQANGLRAIGSNKTAGEKMNGKRYNIELVMRRKIHYLRTDTELEREYLTYAWRKKRTGEIIDEPQDGNDHIMDALAYAVRDMERKPIQYAQMR